MYSGMKIILLSAFFNILMRVTTLKFDSVKNKQQINGPDKVGFLNSIIEINRGGINLS